MPWVKGQSGNPGGRPRAVAEVRDLAREQTATAIETLAHICLHGRSETARITAASELLDRGWGKPLTTTDVNLSSQPKPIEECTDAELRARLAVIRGDVRVDFDKLKRQHEAQVREREQHKRLLTPDSGDRQQGAERATERVDYELGA